MLFVGISSIFAFAFMVRKSTNAPVAVSFAFDVDCTKTHVWREPLAAVRGANFN